MSGLTASRPQSVKVMNGSGKTWLAPLEALQNLEESTPEKLNGSAAHTIVTHTAGLIDAAR
jgi:hypothetical protein